MFRGVALVTALLAFAPALAAAPYVPADDAAVLETLPEQSDPALSALKRLQRASRAAPNDLDLATRFARNAIQAARSTGDPRYLGQASSALAPWWSAQDAPAPALLLRATIRQSLHDFDGALRDLDRLLERTPGDGQARLTRASVRTAIGRYHDALKDCDALEGQALPIVVAACRADTASRAGRAKEAYAIVVRTLDSGRGDAVVRAWATTTAAEIAQRLGDVEAARTHFRQALALDPASPYTLGAYADFLLDAGQPREAATLLEGRTRNDSLLLRYVLALRELPAREAFETHRVELAARMEAARLRGDGVHLREEARYALVIERNPAAALKLAHANWNAQREPADLRLLAESARAAGNAAALRVVADWVEATKLEDVRLRALLKGGA